MWADETARALSAVRAATIASEIAVLTDLPSPGIPVLEREVCALKQLDDILQSFFLS